MNEFELIRRYFAGLTPADTGLRLGIGDDCALLQLPAGEELAVTTDTLVAGRHFPERTPPADIGWKSLAVSLSDLAAMGAQPRWFTLALTLPEAEAAWLEAFAAGLRELAMQHRCTLAGGDTTRGPLSITITALGTVPPGQALRRDGAKAGDSVCVTGTLGDAALGLRRWRELDWAIERTLPPLQGPSDELERLALFLAVTEQLDPQLPPPRAARNKLVRRNPKASGGADDRFVVERLARPIPRVAAGLALRGLAHAAIDLSDGLAGDLGHILQASGVGARVRVDQLPASPAFQRLAPTAQRLALQAAGGDDYELCVCLPSERVAEARARLDVPLTEIGRIVPGKGLQWVDAAGKAVALDARAYQHFE